MEYRVKATQIETYQKVFTVEADSEAEAIAKVEADLDEADLSVHSMAFQGSEREVEIEG